MNMTGKLYLVGTPIGNLGDLSPRALKTLQSVDFIAAEDTRVSGKLLGHFGVKKPLISCHEHNIRQRADEITDRLLAGESCALVTDAGMPCISDPGEALVRLCAARGVEIVAVPGPTALTAALALSGLHNGRFSFEGFLSVKKASRFAHLEEVRDDRRTLIFYEAPHKLLRTLEDMLHVFGDRDIALAREITKLHEEVVRTTLSEAVRLYREDRSPRGEYVLVIAGAKPADTQAVSFSEAVELLQKRAEDGLSLSAAAKEIAQLTGYKKAELYRAALAGEDADLS